jgi:hypothetical protein
VKITNTHRDKRTDSIGSQSPKSQRANKTIEAELNRDGMYASLATSQGRENAINLQEFGNSNIDY